MGKSYNEDNRMKQGGIIAYEIWKRLLAAKRRH